MRSDLDAAKDWIYSINYNDLAEEFRYHREEACSEERERIVAWLRDKIFLVDIANEIEAGEHLK